MMTKQAEELKEYGNTCFRKRRFTAAIDAYTEAITLFPNNAIYWTNRALCHMKRNDWRRVEADCRKALELDKDCTKALSLLGLSMVESKQLSEGIKYLEKAMERSKAEKLEKYIAFTWDVLAKAKYEEWEHGAALKQNKQEELRTICEKALKVEYEEAVKRLESTIQKSRDHVIVIDDDRVHDSSARRAEAQDYQQRSRTRKREEYLSLNDTYKDRCCTLSEVFDKAAEHNRPAEIPDYLTCKITMEIFKDPVITPGGITYEKSALLEHLQKVGEFDPVTREPLRADQIIPNFAIKAAASAYLKNNGWAYKQQ